MQAHHLPVAILLTVCLSAPAPALAGDGHDHGAAAPAATRPGLPRFAAVSELFELVGVLDGRQIRLYLDRAADNSPVTDARIELEIGGQTYLAARQGADTFEVLLSAVPGPGVLPITATVRAGADADLLAGELDIHADAHADEAAAAPAWQARAGWAVAGLALLAALATAARRGRAARLQQPGGAA
jgi:hypothetical protein